VPKGVHKIGANASTKLDVGDAGDGQTAAAHTHDHAAKKWDSFDAEVALAQLSDHKDAQKQGSVALPKPLVRPCPTSILSCKQSLVLLGDVAVT
jgi:hypothetical protein